ncbi:MAG: glycoside hydrolase family 66 protein [Deinococcales bacterium]
MELLPSKATFAPGEAIEIEVRGATGPVGLSLWHLDRRVAEATLPAGETTAGFPAQPEGGYGVEADGVRTAVDVLADPLARPRYGFVSDYADGRATEGVADNVRRLHLNAVQFYDWMYRHAELLPPQDAFEDALGRRLSLDAVRRLVQAVQSAGASALGYAAVYAAGREAWSRWRDQGLFRADGTPWSLGEDFLWNVDPTSERWLAHLATDLRAAMERVGFDGFHLDQYGAPKRAQRADGTVVDLARAFPALIDRLADELPGARLIFNNVHDVPTWTTARTRQHATYIEVWPPHVRLRHLAELVGKALALGPDRTPILAAYLSTYREDEEAASAAERLLLATVWSHGGGALLHGEEDAVLTDPYYVDHHRLGPASLAATRRSYDFAVRYGDLLFDRGAVDVTRTVLGGINQEIRVEAAVPVTVDPEPGALWARAVRTRRGLLLSLLDLSPQADDLWDAGKRPGRPLTGVRVAVERVGGSAPAFRFAEPDERPAMLALEPEPEGRDDVVELPPFGTWALVWIRDDEG